jgi:MFS family permease
MPQSVLLPVFAGDILHGGPYTLGLLTGASGLGALSGALFLASRTSVLGLGRVIVVATVVLGLGLVGFALSRSVWLSAAFMLATGFGMMVQMAASNTVIQTLVDEDKRGRVMSFYGMAFQGAAPFGSLLAGALADRVGAPAVVFGSGVVCLAAGLAFAALLPRLRERARPVYARLGILPQVAGGLQATEKVPAVTDPCA